MTKPHEQARLFLQKAAEDEILLNKIIADDDISDSIFGFHAQQAVEKLLKAVLAARSIRIRKTHNLRELMDLLADSGIPLAESLTDLDFLTPYGTLGRYENLPFSAPFDRQTMRRLVRETRTWVELQI